MKQPETRYARSGDVNIAYQVFGDGPRDLVVVPGFVSNLELVWEEPSSARFFERLGSFARVVVFDKRGTGLSDRVADMPHLETRMDDVRAVMDAVGSRQAALLGFSEGGPLSCLFSATYPERISALILVGTFARRMWAPDHPYGVTKEEIEAIVAGIPTNWGRDEGVASIAVRAPSVAGDARYRQWYSRVLRMGASPAAAQALMRMNSEINVCDILPVIHVPTLVLHRVGDRVIPIGMGRYLAARIPGAKFVEVPGDDHHVWVGDADSVLDEIEEFLTGARRGPAADSMLATVVFTDVVGATARAAEVGDRRWREILDAHHAAVRAELRRFRGREIDTAGDGFFAAFDGPARAILGTRAVFAAVRELGLTVRAGVHTGECQVSADKLTGLAVHIGARIASLAQPDEILVSRTVKDLVAGSGLRFGERGAHTLKGVPGEWQLYSVEED